MSAKFDNYGKGSAGAGLEGLIRKYTSAKKKIEFFDANCWLGNPVNDSVGRIPATVKEILDAMDYYGINNAVIASSVSVHGNVDYGNRIVMDAIRGNERLYGAGALLPEHTGELGNLEKYVSYLRKNKIVLIRLFPKIHNFTLSDSCAGSMLKILHKMRIPLAIWHTQTTWDEIDKICGKYADLPVIVEGVGRKLFYDNRIFYPLLKKHANLHLETHNITNYLGMDDIVKNFGVKKLVFGTCVPKNDYESAIMPVVYGEFSAKDKKLIAGENIKLLIENEK